MAVCGWGREKVNEDEVEVKKPKSLYWIRILGPSRMIEGLSVCLNEKVEKKDKKVNGGEKEEKIIKPHCAIAKEQ